MIRFFSVSIAWLFLFVSSNCIADISRSMTVTTKLNKNKFVNSTLSIHFSENNFVPDFDVGNNTLKNITTRLVVDTTLANTKENNAIQYALFLQDKTSLCYKFNDLGTLELISPALMGYNYQKQLVTVYVGGNELVLGTPTKLTFDDVSGNYKQSTKKVDLHFGQLPEGSTRCTGEVEVMVEFDI